MLGGQNDQIHRRPESNRLGCACAGADRWRGALSEPAASVRPADAVPQSMEALSFHASPGAEKRERGDALSGAVYGAGGDRRDGKYRRRCRCHLSRRAGGHFLDVDLRRSRDGHEIRGGHAGASLPGENPGRVDRRPHVCDHSGLGDEIYTYGRRLLRVRRGCGLRRGKRHSDQRCDLWRKRCGDPLRRRTDQTWKPCDGTDSGRTGGRDAPWGRETHRYRCRAAGAVHLHCIYPALRSDAGAALAGGSGGVRVDRGGGIFPAGGDRRGFGLCLSGASHRMQPRGVYQ